MKTRLIDNVEVREGSDNIFADIGLPDAEKLLMKANLVVEIQKAIQKNGLSQTEAAKRMGISQPKVSEMLRGHFSNLSERKLMDCLTRLGYDIEIKVRPTKANMGRMTFAVI
jgi:predicted XRE-type DNA-binding protein